MNVYTKLDGKLAKFEVDTDNYELARIEVYCELRLPVGAAVLAVIDGGKTDE